MLVWRVCVQRPQEVCGQVHVQKQTLWGPQLGSLNPLTDTLAVQMKRGGNRGAMTQRIPELGRKLEGVSEKRKQQADGCIPAVMVPEAGLATLPEMKSSGIFFYTK